MTITVTPEPLNAPPRNVVEVSVPAGSVMSSVAVWRNDLNGRTLLRSQPAAGFDSRTVFDYESPYGTSVTYDWAAQYTDPTAYVTLFNETWANTSSWTNLGGTWNVSGGAVTGNGAGFPLLQRSFAKARYRVTIASISATSPFATGVQIFDSATNAGLRLNVISGNPYLLVNDTQTTIDKTQPITIDLNNGSATVSGTGGSHTLSGTFEVDKINLAAGASYSLTVGAIRVYSYPAPSSVAETSSPVSLSPVDAWLVNVATPSLSFPLTGSNPFKAGIDFIGSVTNPTNTTRHQILGSDRVLPVTTGPRGDDETQMGIYTATNAERVALRALLKPDIPILVNIPADWDYDFESGFYSVGDVESDRQADPRHKAHMRRATLPMVRVSSPVVTVENSGWSYAAVAVEFATYTSLPMSFDTYADLASNTRS